MTRVLAISLVSLFIAAGTSGQTFTKITSGPLVTDGKDGVAGTWVDYDNDGDPDVFVSNGASQTEDLYRNNGNGTFTRITGIALTTVRTNAGLNQWGDYNNDDHLDVFVANLSGFNRLWRNDGGGLFTQITSGPVVNTNGSHRQGAWGDYDNDGNLDLVVSQRNGGTNHLYRNNGNGTFTSIANVVSIDGGNSTVPSWIDYDDDGDLDLFIGNTTNEANFLYRNNGNSTFTKITAGPLVTDLTNAAGGAWGDYNNDGDLDVFVPNTRGQNNALYKNKGGGVFKRVNTGPLVSDNGDSNSGSWCDIDNDGDLDLFVANRSNEANFLYRNDGNGTFTRITSGAIVTDTDWSGSSAWADYNNDGYRDLYVTNDVGQNNALYENDGGSNNWLKVKLVGTSSNRSGYGALVRVKARITGQLTTEAAQANAGATWQMRQIGGANDVVGQSHAAVAHFGMGDAATALKVRVEWPSGLVTVHNNVPVNQTLVLTEPAFGLTLKRVFLKPNGTKKAVLKWTAADVSTSMVDFYIDRAPNGTPDKRTRNDGKHKLTIPLPGNGPFAIQGCEENSTSVCSNIVRADFTGAIVSLEPDDDETDQKAMGKVAPVPLVSASNYPNPFNPATTIHYDLAETAQVTLSVYDALGRRVRTLVSGILPTGPYAAEWDGRDDAGMPVGSGVYLYRIVGHTTTTAFAKTGRMLLNK